MTRRRRRGPPDDLNLSALTSAEPHAPAPREEHAAQRQPSRPQHLNVALYLKHLAGASPDRSAIVAVGRRGEKRVTFRQLDENSSRIARALVAGGFSAGSRALVAARSTVETAELACALWKLGASAALLQPGTQSQLGAQCAALQPTALVGTLRAQLARLAGGAAMASVRQCVALGPWIPMGLPGGCPSLDALVLLAAPGAFETAATLPEHEALVVGSLRGELGHAHALDHGAVMTRIEALRAALPVDERTVAAVSDPLGALVVAALGATACVPDRRWGAGRVAARDLAGLFRRPGVSVAVATAREWQELSDRAETKGLVLPRLTAVIVGAASPRLHARVSRLVQGGETHALFGVLEAFPLAAITGAEVRGDTAALSARGGGSCVGAVTARVEVALVAAQAAYLPEWREDLRAAAGDVGEIVVRGVLAARPAIDAGSAGLHAIAAAGGSWLRTGELAWADRQGRLWHCGARADRLDTPRGPLYPACAEAIFEAHPRVAHAWVIGHGAPGAQEPVLVVESDVARGEADRVGLELELLDLAQSRALTSGIRRALVRPRSDSVASRADVLRWAEQRLTART